MTERELAERLKRAVSRGDVMTARRLLKGGVSLNNTSLWWGSSLLHEAVSEAKTEMIQILLQGKCDIDIQDQAGQTPLHLASRRGNLEIVRTLLDNGADINISTTSGRAPLHIATWRNHTEVAGHLVASGANTNQQDEDGWSSLHWAAKGGHGTLVEDMMAKGAKINIPDKRGQTPLHVCLQNKQVDVDMMKLLLRNGADPNQRTKNKSSLDILLQNSSSNQEAVRNLLQGGYLAYLDHKISLSQSSPEAVRTLLATSRSDIPTLFHLCRCALRKYLNRIHGGRAIAPYVKQFPVPQLVKEFLMFTEELST